MGGGRNYGNVFVDGKPICDVEWDLRDAQVVCAMLNLRDALAATTRSAFGRVRPPFGRTKVGCEGNETDIRDCSHSIVIPSWWDCNVWAAGVVCRGGNTGL